MKSHPKKDVNNEFCAYVLNVCVFGLSAIEEI